MCTVVLLHRVSPGRPLVALANRDERLDRPATPPQRWDTNGIFAPRDLVARGTWIGINEAGLFVAITNRFGAPPDLTRKSRGELVSHALERKTAQDAFEVIRKRSAADYNGFHLLMADLERAYLIVGDGTNLRAESLEPGIHVVTERSFGASDTRRAERVAAEFRAKPVDTPLEALIEPLRTHVTNELGPDPVGSSCVHWPALNYGTRSSSAVELTADGARWLHADGPPCVTPLQELDTRA